MATEYVLIYARPVNNLDERVLLVLKDRPEWQKGKYNLLGGKIEEGETPEEAAVRELKEEAGYEPEDIPIYVGKITGSWGTVHCVHLKVDSDLEIQPRDGETELIQWMDWNEIRRSKLLMPNLKTIIPLIKNYIKDWIVKDEGPDWRCEEHTYEVILKVTQPI